MPPPQQPVCRAPCPATPARLPPPWRRLTGDDEENPNQHLEEEGDADEHDEGGVVLEGGALLQHSLELGDIGHEECHVQHALGHALLGGVVVDVHGSADPQVRSHALGRQEEPQALLNQHTHLCPVGGWLLPRVYRERVKVACFKRVGSAQFPLTVASWY